MRSRMGSYNRQVMEQYALPNVLEQMAALYRQLLKEE
jgi:hypothetical protein